MDLHGFIQENRERWRELSTLLEGTSRKGLVSLSRSAVRQFSKLYRKAASDLAYAQLHYPQSKLTRELESLVGQAHSRLYRGQPLEWAQGWRFFTEGFPRLFRQTFRYTAVATVIFFIGVAYGYLSTASDPEFAHLIIPPGIRASMEEGEIWTVPITAVKPLASAAIWQNNVMVTLFTFAFGIAAGLGTLYLLAFNGVLFGAIFAYVVPYGFAGDLGLFVVTHGVLEIPMLFIAGAGGLLLARGMLLPGDRPRKEHFWHCAGQGVQLVLGCLPFLALAAVIEAFFSPYELPPSVKLPVAGGLFSLFACYLFFAGRSAEATQDRT